jgi:hypothetical protein
VRRTDAVRRCGGRALAGRGHGWTWDLTPPRSRGGWSGVVYQDRQDMVRILAGFNCDRRVNARKLPRRTSGAFGATSAGQYI